MIRGTAVIDLRNVKPPSLRHRASAIARVPEGAWVIVEVGPLKVDPETIRILREHRDRVNIHLMGEPFAVGKWLDSLRTGAIAGVLF